MKAKTILLLLLAAAVVRAQTAPPSQKVAPSGTAGAATAKPAATPAAKSKSAAKPQTAAKPKSAAKAQAASKPAAHAKAPAKKAVAKGPAQPAAAEVKKAMARTNAPGKRDPFVSVVVSRSAGPGSGCESGKKCLDINAVVLRGIVKGPNGMIAVVENSTRRITYFLRENDPVFNGYVVKITGDSIVFRENVMDTMGRGATRDVIKRVSAPAV